ncbi:MAG: holo-ACP synthase [Dehalococcoidales bacterium]|nr:holo-ACP synthase [Dehalococcoidales bacterium]MDZ4230543.1 holo-ACP synthase [Dehalococcoidales bacterium]
MQYIGIDIIEIARIRRARDTWGEKFLRKVYTEPELRLYREKPSSLAARFAGKEAVIKAIGTETKGIRWKDIEILAEPGGQPSIKLYGRARTQARNRGLGKLAISLSHSREYAIALVVGETR